MVSLPFHISIATGDILSGKLQIFGIKSRNMSQLNGNISAREISFSAFKVIIY